MHGSREFCWRGYNFDNVFFIIFFLGGGGGLVYEGREDAAGHHRPASKTPFKLHFASVRM